MDRKLNVIQHLIADKCVICRSQLMERRRQISRLTSEIDVDGWHCPKCGIEYHHKPGVSHETTTIETVAIAIPVDVEDAVVIDSADDFQMRNVPASDDAIEGALYDIYNIPEHLRRRNEPEPR